MNDTSSQNLGAPVPELNQQLHDLAQRYADQPLMRLGARLGKLGDQPPMLATSALVLAIRLASARPRTMFAGVRMIAAHLLATGAKHVLKRNIDRERPGQRPARKRRYRAQANRTRRRQPASRPATPPARSPSPGVWPRLSVTRRQGTDRGRLVAPPRSGSPPRLRSRSLRRSADWSGASRGRKNARVAQDCGGHQRH